MTPESLTSYHHNEDIQNLTFLLKNAPCPVYVELQSGKELPIKNVYSISGRGECIKILIHDPERQNLADIIEDLKKDRDLYEEEAKDLKEELKEYQEIGEPHILANLENEAESISDTLERIEKTFKFRTAAISNPDRLIKIEDLIAEKILDLDDKIKELEIDNQSLAWNLEQHEKATPNSPTT